MPRLATSLIACGAILAALLLGTGLTPATASLPAPTVAITSSAGAPSAELTPRSAANGVLGSWSTLGSGTSLRTNVLLMYDDTLYAGGDFTSAGGVTGTSYIAAWSTRTNSWHALGNGMVASSVWALAADDDTVYVGGAFTSASGVPGTAKLAGWSYADDTWHAVATSSPTYTVISLAQQGDDTLAVGEEFGVPTAMPLVNLSTATWASAPTPTFNQRIEAIAVQGSVTASTSDDTIYVGGPFTTPGNYVAALTPGGGSWATLGTGLNNEVRVLALRGQATPSVADDTLYAGGFFTDAGGDPAGDGIAAWSNVDDTWHALGSGLDDVAFAIAVDETRDLVYAGGRFTQFNGGPTNSLRRIGVWDAGIAAWIPLQFGAAATDNGISGGAEVEALAIDDSLLYIGGNLDNSVPNGNFIRRWTWSPPTGTVDDTALPGTVVTIQGSGLIGVTSVTFGSARTGDDTPATFIRDDSTTIHVTVPAGDFHDDTVYVNAVGGVAQVGPFTSWPTWPDAPQAPEAEPGVNSATVDWDPPASDGGSTVTTYTATASPGGATCATTATACGIGGLESGTSYTFTVRATNVKGTSAASVVSNAVTPLAPPPPVAPGPPREVTAVPGDRSANVRWSEPESAGSYPVTTYQVQSTPAGGSCLTETLSCEVGDLANGTAYTFAVRALTGAGWGPWSQPSAAVTPRGRSILISGSREGRSVSVTGTTSGMASGAPLVAWIRFPGSADFSPGRRTAEVSDGTFTWQRRTKRTITVYFTHGATKSNTVTIAR
ncbi:MAG: fibronectin type III domain-containing protein [bacterium]